MSCTSRSMLALLLASVFIFSAITCPVMRCCTWNKEQPAFPVSSHTDGKFNSQRLVPVTAVSFTLKGFERQLE